MSITRRQVLSSLTSAGALLALPSTSFAGRLLSDPHDPFLAAVVRGDVERVQSMLAADAALVRARDAAGRSAFVLAHLHGHPRVAEVLRATGLELDVVEAVLAEDWPRVEALAAAEPRLLQRAHPIGGTPLYAAALVGSRDQWRLRGLGCLPDAAPPGGSGFTPARAAVESQRASWARIALTDLCSNGADVNARQRGGSSVLHGAVQRRDETLVRLALRKGARLDAVDDQGRTPHALALELDWEAGARLLAAPGATPRDNRASRFLLDANREPVQRPDLSEVPRALQNRVTGASHAKLDRVRELVATDARLAFSVSTDDELAIEACAHTGMRSIIRFHLDHGAPLSLPTAVSLGDEAAIDFWLTRDPSLVHERGAHDFPVLWYAVLGGGSVAIAERLARHGVPLDQETLATTALHLCAKRDDPDLAHWLLERGVDKEGIGYAWSRDGQTPLEIAVQEGHDKVARLLKDAGARR